MNLAKTLKATATAYKMEEGERNHANILAMCSNAADKGLTSYVDRQWKVHWQTVMALEAEGFILTIYPQLESNGIYTTPSAGVSRIASGDIASLSVSWSR